VNDDAEERATKWLVGDRLSSVLHLGDTSLAYTLVDQGHEVVVAGPDVAGRRHSDILYVRTDGSRLPFTSSVFDVVIAPSLVVPVAMFGEYARVLRHGGWLSASGRRHDESIPWLRKLREIIGMTEPIEQDNSTLHASGLFDEPEEMSSSAWEQLDLDAMMRFARANRHPSVPDAALSQARALFDTYAAQTGFLRLRHETRCVRARVDKSQLGDDAEQIPDTVLFDLN